MESTRCNLCDADDYAPLLDAVTRWGSSDETFHIVRCSNCGLAYLNPRPEEDVILDFYPDDYHRRDFSIGELGDQRLFGLPWRQAIERKYAPLLRLQNPARILDVGCGDGFLLKYLEEKGWEVVGIEPGNSVCARETLGLDVFQGPLEAADFAAGSFDVVTLSHVLEHLHDPAATLQRVRYLLRDNGLVHIEVPNIASMEARIFGDAWIGIAAPAHLYLFAPTTLQAIVEKVGFDVFESGFAAASPNESAGFSESLRFSLADRGWYRRENSIPAESARPSVAVDGSGRWRVLRRLLHRSEAKLFYALSGLMNKVGRGANIYVIGRKQGNVAAA